MTADGTECWAMSSDKYCDSAVKNVENVLAKKRLTPRGRCFTHMSSGYRPDIVSSSFTTGAYLTSPYHGTMEYGQNLPPPSWS